MNLKDIHENICSFLGKNYNDLGTHRNFYGYSFLALSFYKNKKVLEFCVNRYNKIDQKKVKNFHWEFNNYAWISLLKNDPVSYSIPFIGKDSIVFCNNNVSNWFFLKQLCLLKIDKNDKKALVNSKERLESFQDSEGLIWDDYNNKSFQYHCYSSALIEEIYTVTNDTYVYRSFIKSVDFIINFILPNGMSLYIGRGQEQIFGYGTLIYVLEKAYVYTSDKKYKYFQSLVISYVGSFIDDSGTLPLVLNKSENSIKPKKGVNVNNTHFKGWYGYNNYYDYLPFFLYYIGKTLETHEVLNNNNFVPQYKFSNKEFFVQENKKYIMVLSRSVGSMTNDLPLPLLYDKYNNRDLTVFYGGEEFGSKLYSNSLIPLPYGRPSFFSLFKIFSLKDFIYYSLGNLLSKENYKYYFFRKSLQYRMSGGNYIGENNYIKHTRHFSLNNNSIHVNDSFLFKKAIKFDFFVPLSFFGKKTAKIGVNSINFGDVKYCFKDKISFKDLKGKYCNAKYLLYGYKHEIKSFRMKRNNELIYEYEIVLGK